MKRIFLFLSLVSLCSAIGLFAPQCPDSCPMYVGNSVVLLELEDSFEILSVNVLINNYYYGGYGTAYKFAWLIPLPEMPGVLSPNDVVLAALSKISGPIYKETYSSGCGFNAPEAKEIYGKDYYEVLKYPAINPETFDTLYAPAIDTIIDWLGNYGITLPTYSQNLINGYINKDWKYFYVAIYSCSHESRVSVTLKFPSSSEIIPMYISRANKFYGYSRGYYEWGYGTPKTSVYTYSISNHKKAYPLGELLYANNLTSEELENISNDFPALAPKLISDDYLTKLEIEYENPEQSISEDIVLQNAADDKEYRELAEEYDYWYLTTNPLLIFFLLLLLIRRLKNFKRYLKTIS